MTNPAIPNEEKDSHQITLIGHSRGGGISVLKAAQDDRVKALITWASVSDYAVRFPKGAAFDEWKTKGIYYVKNGRTKQRMPHYFQFFEDFEKHSSQLDIQAAAKSLKKPYLIIHGEEDEAVSPHEARASHQWNTQSTLLLIPHTGHTFGSKHPYEAQDLPVALQRITDESIAFLKRIYR